jgi:hypothetical protein
LERISEPVHLQCLPCNRIFVATNGRVDRKIEQRIDWGIFVYDLKGNLLSRTGVFPGYSCRRFPNGSIATYSNQGFLVSNGSGKDIVRFEGEHVYSNGQFLPQGALLEIDFPVVDGSDLKFRKSDLGSGNELAKYHYHLNAQGAHFFHAACESGETLLIWMNDPDKVFEMTTMGNHILRTLEMPRLWATYRFRDSTLVLAHNQGRDSRIVEIDSKGRLVWQAFGNQPGVDRITSCFPLIRFGFNQPTKSKSAP